MTEKMNDIWETLLDWDKVEALECLGIKIDLTDGEQVEIAGKKAEFEKLEELKDEAETKRRTAEFIDNMFTTNPREALDKLFKIK